eukprot:4988_1
MKRNSSRIICYLIQLLLVLYFQSCKTQTQTYTNTFKSVVRLLMLLLIILHTFKSIPIINIYTTNYNWFCQLGAKIILQSIVIYPIQDLLQYSLLIFFIFYNYGPPHVIMGFPHVILFNFIFYFIKYKTQYLEFVADYLQLSYSAH